MLTIAHVDAERGFSGGQEQVFLLMEGLRGLGHQNVLFCPPGSRCEAEARARGLEARAVPMGSELDLRSVLRLRRELSARTPSIVHLHTGRATWLGGLAARSAEVPAVTTRRMDRRVKRNWRTRLIYRHLVRRAVAISPAVARRLAEGGVPAGMTATIPSAVDPGRLRPTRARDELRRDLGLDPDEDVLLTLASLVRRKGLDVLVDALPRLRSKRRYRLLVAGDGPERAALEERARDRGVAERVRFLGARADKADLLAACDVFVLPSRREGLGVAALEAMAAGRPVVATRVGGLGEAVVDGVTGLLVAPEDPSALAAALTRLCDDAELARAYGAAGPERVARGHLPEQMVAAYEELYLEVLDGKRKP